MAVMHCATHPRVETVLTCATCGKPICPDCMVETPVGMKCQDCGRAPLPRIYVVGPGSLVVGIVVGALLGALAGALALVWRTGFGLFLFFLGPVAGGLIGDAAWRVTGGKRGPVMAAVVAASCAVGIVLLGPQLLAFGAGGGAVSPGELVPVLLGRPFFLLYASLAAATAFWRVR